MSFLLITPTDGSPESRAHLQILVGGLALQEERCELMLVARGENSNPELPIPDNVTLRTVTAPLAISLSRARNLALTRARAVGLLDRCDAVAFPDDDCAYPPGTLTRAARHMGNGADMVCAVCGPTPGTIDWQRFPAQPLEVDTSLIMRAQNSGTMFFTTRLVAALGDFDERFGLGARFGSAEDSDYMIRALAVGARATYDPGLIVLHPYKRHRHEQYFAGNVAVLAKHAFGPSRTLVDLLKRLAVGLLLVARRRLGANTYAAALGAAARMLPSAGQSG
ncbi:MAG TPA: hypothetical protein VG388_06000 [Solirubrobacteraceae bacterium]|nr:hypothetical protein [Solirubrobacteraceae bacterium]